MMLHDSSDIRDHTRRGHISALSATQFHLGAVVGTLAGAFGIGLGINNIVNAPSAPDGNPAWVALKQKEYYDANGGVTSIPTYGNQAQSMRAGVGQNANPNRIHGGEETAVQALQSQLSSQNAALQDQQQQSSDHTLEYIGITLGVLSLGAALFLHHHGKK